MSTSDQYTITRADGSTVTVGGRLSSNDEPLKLSIDGLAVVYELGNIVALLAEVANALHGIQRSLEATERRAAAPSVEVELDPAMADALGRIAMNTERIADKD